jgi:hypothetical protein
MSERLRALQDMIRTELRVNDATLREETKGSTCRPVKIRRSGPCLVLSFNTTVASVCIKDRLFPLFREQEGVARMCDYWILCERGDEDPILYVLLCELKSGDPKDGIAQIENGRLLAEYVLDMVSLHRGVGMREGVEVRGLVFSPNGLSLKAGLRPGRTVYAPRGRLRTDVAFLRDGAEYHVSALCG